MTAPVVRLPEVLRPDPSRVLAKLFLPGQELLADGVSRAQAVLARVLALPEESVEPALELLRTGFGARHPDLDEMFAEHCTLVSYQLPVDVAVSHARRLLIGAYCTQEYAVEAAALFNPSMVVHPDQTGMAPGQLRFVMSVRAVGEGHISSIGFRTGVVSSNGVMVDPPGAVLTAGRVSSTQVSREYVQRVLAAEGLVDNAGPVLELLRSHFTASHLDDAEATLRVHRQATFDAWGARTAAPSGTDEVVRRLRQIHVGHYRLVFDADSSLSERILYPTSDAERQGLEDARFTRFIEGAAVEYLATYTAFDGSRIAPKLLRTSDFRVFDVIPLTGAAAKDKGMAVFPRRIRGRYLALARWDRESLCLASSDDLQQWEQTGTLQVPGEPWNLIQLGNCGPPIETPEGWLVLTHGVGAMRVYSISALLLDLDDPTRVIGSLAEPLLVPSVDERDGYVPNVVYSCGALVHDGRLVLPYGCSDSSIRFALVDLADLLAALLGR